MAKSQNPMDAFRREQKKKELKKNQVHRQREKQAKLHELDVDEIRDRLKKLERQVQQNPADGPTRKRKQELEDTLQAVLKKQKAIEEEEKEKEASAKTTTTLADLNAANRERYQNPENSIYYHPVLNPFGAPPPGRPQMYRVPPPKPVAIQRPSAPQNGQHKQPPQPQMSKQSGGSRAALYPPTGTVQRPSPAKPQRPGKRPPLPPGPPPPGTIQVPRQPPLPSAGGAVAPGATTTHGSATSAPSPPPPPAPPAMRMAPPSPPPPPPALPVAEAVFSSEDVDMDGSDVVGVYPPQESDDADQSMRYHIGSRRESDDEEDEERAEQQQRLRSLVPTTLRVQRAAKPKPPTAAVVPRPPPLPPGPSLPLAPGPSTGAPKPADASSSVSSDFDAFMEEMKSLGAV